MTEGGLVVAVCRVHDLLRDRGTVGVTAIDTRPVSQAVRIRPLGLYGDVQADRAHHGGEDQAVYAYAEEDAARFAAELGRDIEPGLFGENLRTRAVDVSGAIIGERWAVGDEVVLEVTSPRVPCGTFERRMGVDGWRERFTERGAPGAYLRVVRSGDVRPGDAVTVIARPTHGVPIGRWFQHHSPADARALHDADLRGDIHVSDDTRRYIDRSLRKAVAS